MEPSSSRASIVPKLHVICGASSPRNDERVIHSYGRSVDRYASPQSTIGNWGVRASTARSNIDQYDHSQHMLRGSTDRLARSPCPPSPHSTDKVIPPRVIGSIITRIESPQMPRSRQRNVGEPALLRPEQLRSCPAEDDSSSKLDEFRILHPSLDLTDESGELSQLMLSKWSVHSGEESFASISLFCEMKLSEAKRMASCVEMPNRFYTIVCCQLMDKYIQHIVSANRHRDIGEKSLVPTGHSDMFLKTIHAELVNAIFLTTSSSQHPPVGSSPGSSSCPYTNRIPYFTEYKRLKRNSEFLMAAVERREKNTTSRHQFSAKINKLVTRFNGQNNRRTLTMIFRAWANLTATEKEIRSLKCRVFRSARRFNLSSVFRAWRVESLRRVYQRESVEYQTMLSITAASLSRKDILIADAESKLTSMARINDSLTDSNKQLMHRIEQLESMATAGYNSESGSGTNNEARGSNDSGSAHSRPVMNFEHIDTLISQDDERMDRINRMLLETMFGMARMVESCAIQMSKDIMDSLEYQLDGSILQNLAEMVQSDNILKAQTSGITNNLNSTTSGGNISTPNGHNQTSKDASTPAASIKRAVTIKDLVQMPIDALLLNWFRMNLNMSSSVEKAGDRVIKNFTTDLMDGRRYSFLLHRLFPAWFDSSMVHEIDGDQRLRNIETFHSRIQPELPQVVTSDSIHASSVVENVAFVAMLFGSSVGAVRKINLERQRLDFLSIITSWKRVRSLLLEVKRMNENYDSMVVMHLLKEMRTCETLFKQLNNDLSSIAITSNETSSALSQIAYKILGLTWNCIRAKQTNQIVSLNIIDGRWKERIKEFTSIEISSVRELLVHETQIEHQQQVAKQSRRGSVTASIMMPVVPEREVQLRLEALRNVLFEYSKDLFDIFKHYSASGGAGSIASMSLAEYNKLIKDCLICDHKLTMTTVEGIYMAALASQQLASFVTSTESHVSISSTDLKQDDTREMVGREFVDAMVRIAAAKFTSIPLEERFRALMEQSILPNALRSQSEIFRAEVASSKIRTVFQKHKLTLQRIFRYYTSMYTMRGQQSTISLKEFTVFAKDCKLIGSFITEHTLKQILVNLQHDVEPGSEDDLRANFDDFQEAIAALTEYVICNPYVPLHKRIEQFINEMLIPRARQKKKVGNE